MKTSHSLISMALVVAIVFAACTSSTSDKGSAATTDTATATNSVNTGDANQDKLEANKKVATEFIQSLFGDKDSNAIDKYIADDIKQHNPILQDGKEWLKNALRPFLENPNMEKTKVDIDMVAAEGDMVWLLIKDVAPNKKVFARVDIFRIENGKIAEAWKVSEPVPVKSENTNSMF